jgi:hypothetical protein
MPLGHRRHRLHTTRTVGHLADRILANIDAVAAQLMAT